MKRLCCCYSHYHYPPSYQVTKQYCSSTSTYTTTTNNNNNKHKWQSKTKVIITNPTLLTMECCTTMKELKQIHAHMTRNGLIAHTFPASRVLAFCALADSGDIRHARSLFSHFDNPNTYMWNTMIRGCFRARIPNVGFQFFARMVRDCVQMDSLSFVYALKACEKVMDFELGGSVCCVIRKMGFDADLFVRNGLVRYYAERGWFLDARKMFDESPVRDVVTWTTLIDGYEKWGLWDQALEVFEAMLSSGSEPNEVTMIAVLSACGGKGDACMAKRAYDLVTVRGVNCSLNLLNSALDMFAKCGSIVKAREIFDCMRTRDVFSWTSMVDGYAKCAELDSARKLFDEMPERNAISWNAMIAGYSQNNQPKEALKLFYKMMKEGLVPTEHTLVSILSSCGQLGCLDLGQWIHHHYIKQKRIQPSVILSNALIDMYGKCGRIDAAASLFNEMSHRNLVSWNTMIAGYAVHGYAKQARMLFEQMKHAELKPNDITFVAVLSACSHGGLVSEGREYFKSMAVDFGLVPKEEHYACMIDLLGRIGLLKEAYDMIKSMPMEPSESGWGALLNACKIHGNVELAGLSAQKLLDLDPHDSGVYVSLANALANEKKWAEVRRVRSLMREKCVKKNPGLSSIEIEGVFHEFLAGDESHPQSKQIYRILNDVYLLLSLEDYNVNPSQTSEQNQYMSEKEL